MNHLLRILVTVGLVVFALLAVALGLAREDANLLAPVHLLLFLVGMALYVFPACMAMYRDCKSTVWIALLNILLGWTLFGWVIAVGWAASGETRPPASRVQTPPTHPVLGH